MYNIELHWKILQMVAIFHRLRMWSNEEETIFRKIGKIICLTYFMCYIISLSLGACSTDDMSESLFLVAIAIMAVVLAIKLAFILYKKEEILDFLRVVCVHSPEGPEHSEQIRMKVNSFIKFISFYLYMVVIGTLTTIFSSLPAFASDKRLPLNVGFPWYWKNNEIGYWSAYAFVLAAEFLGTVTVLLTIIIWYLMLNCSIKYETLGNRFKAMAAVEPNRVEISRRKISEADKQKLFFETFIGLIKTHRNIKETINRFKYRFSNIFFMQITTSGISICCSVYVLAFSSHGNLIQSAMYTILLAYHIFDIFMVMYFGNEIKLSSDRLSYCLFESDWIDLSQSCKINIIILSEVLKQPQELLIGKLYPLNMKTFTSILNLAYSSFNVLQNFH